MQMARTRDDYLRDNLLVTMGCRAGYLNRCGYIELPYGVDGEDELADFCRETVDEYTDSDSDVPFDEFIEEKLNEQYESSFFRQFARRT